MVRKKYRQIDLKIFFRARTRMYEFFADGEKQIYLQKKRYVSVNIVVKNSAMGEGMVY
jgi:hypothetical protein